MIFYDSGPIWLHLNVYDEIGFNSMIEFSNSVCFMLKFQLKSKKKKLKKKFIVVLRFVQHFEKYFTLLHIILSSTLI